MTRASPARIVESMTAAGHVTIELRCSCGRTAMTLATDRATTIAELLRRHRQASPMCQHLAALELSR